MSGPEVCMAPLPKPDGSARLCRAGYTITASVNGPIEAQKKDEHVYEAYIDVVVRPAAGVGGIRERQLESILQSSLSHLILVQDFPRSVVQIVLQIEGTPENDYATAKLVQAGLNLPILPALFQAAILSLLSAAVPMKATATGSAAAVVRQGQGKRIVVDPSARDLDAALSVHVLAFTSPGDLLLAESEGDFTMEEWDLVYEAVRKICYRSRPTNTGMEMLLDDGGATLDLRDFIRSTIETKIDVDLDWT